ncbi:Fur-regulated basic protein FbpA [Kurthia sibirica]|nr:Fur-regulated basic protein FbpA [Kurthia sibirica]GEK33774.1 hypothetical protein KSI01_13070 [Kurthia sibirica]
MTENNYKQQEAVKTDVIDHLMELGIYKINDLQLYQVPLSELLLEYKKQKS